MEKNSKDRETGTDSLTNTYKEDTPGQTKAVIKNIKKLSEEKTKPKLIKNTVIINPRKKDTEFVHKTRETQILPGVREDEQLFAMSTDCEYNDFAHGDCYMATHSKGGGKKREGLESDTKSHIITQLRNVKNLREEGGTPVTFDDDVTCLVNQKYAIYALRMYEKLEKPAQKEALARKFFESPKSFLNVIQTSDEYIISELERFIHEQKQSIKNITVPTCVDPELSNHRIMKVVLEDHGNVWVSHLHYNGGEVIATNHTKEGGIIGLNKLREHIQNTICSRYGVHFDDRT